ncbi:MAG: trypsin-like peptidase domain-containing protein [Armatimonadetes bacterium]|nr:trypsin-like peptidase domain-containing protein [Armatimonadota bacterium]
MSNRSRLSIFALTGGLIACAVPFSARLVAREPAARLQEGRDTAQSLEVAFTQLAESMGPSAVSISAVAEVPRSRSPFEQFLGPDAPQTPGQGQRRRRPNTPAPAPAPGASGDEADDTVLRPVGGSGVIIRSDGYILTNDHVVEKARDGKVKVKLSSGETFTGKVFRDSRSDLAVVKIDAGRALPAVKFADSGRIKVGQWAIAIGSPFGQDNTVTTGIVSALQRKSTIGGPLDGRYYPELIQTDASINPGNSGGPLFNIKGELIGINVGIDTPSGGSVGIGFAIPANTARLVSEQLIAQGKVTRGFLGMNPTNIEPEIKQALKLSAGAYVSQVTGGEPADMAGLEPGDVITRFGTNDVRDEVSLRNAIATTKPGTKVPILVSRAGKELTLSATLKELPDERSATAKTATNRKPAQPLEATLEPLDAEIRTELKLEEAVKGVFVTEVKSGTPTDEAGLSRGMIIQSVNGTSVATVEELKKVASTVRSGGIVMLRVLLPSRTGKPSRAAINVPVP